MRSSSEEQFFFGAVYWSTAAEINCPELVNANHRAGRVLHHADELTGRRIEGIDGAAVRIVGDQQGVAERPEIGRCNGKSPGLVQWRALSETLYELTALGEKVNETTSCS